ncbi:putative dehydrogenase [Haloferula luteola]|uniref:Putative dehydrogenase n=2 Tax=Haloferula luteola TaxID=595692 RepID=A0A840UZ90_9BACT|nr:putative dehydrogenase [Haloferula luteola]
MHASFRFGRRQFLQGIGAASLVSLAGPAFGALGANGRIRIGMIGCGGRADALRDQFSREPDVEIVAMADPEQKHLDAQAAKVPGVAKYQDYRKLLERNDIDAVIISSPNYWHALQTIHACQAGKDVYVEKPVTSSLDQSGPMLEAATRYQRIVQAGTQNRSDTGLIEAFGRIQEGEFGKIQAIRGLCYRNRTSIGKRDTPLKPSESLDYQLWLGPCQDRPILRPKLHYDWHWDYNTGNGDIGNQAPHEFDLIRWVLGDPQFTGGVESIGQRFGWDDAGNTPNLQTVWFDWAGVPVVFEVNDMMMKPDLNASPAYRGVRVGVVVTCEGGEFRGGRGGGYVVGEDGKTKIAKFPGDAGGGHARNFLDAVKSRDAKSLKGQLANAINACEVIHLGNLSHRSGSPVPRKQLIEEVPESIAEVIERQEKQLAFWGIDTNKVPYHHGPVATLDADGKVGGGAAIEELAKPQYREGFEIPKEI